jgi:hypothetical protein
MNGMIEPEQEKSTPQMSPELAAPSDVSLEQPKEPQFSVPTFGIIHLLAWMTVAAMMLGFCKSAHFFQSNGNMQWIPWLLREVPIALLAIVFSAGIVGIGEMFRRQWWRRYADLQPGHRLLLASYIFLVLTVLVVRSLSLYEKHTFLFFVICFLALCANEIFWLLAARKLNDSNFWKWLLRFAAYFFGFAIGLFILIPIFLVYTYYHPTRPSPVSVGLGDGAIIAILYFAAVVVYFAVVIVYLAQGIVISEIAVLISILNDRKQHRRRDWLHYFAAVVVYLAQAIVVSEISVLISKLNDRKQHRPRDWLHWLGVIEFALLPLHFVLIFAL